MGRRGNPPNLVTAPPPAGPDIAGLEALIGDLQLQPPRPVGQPARARPPFGRNGSTNPLDPSEAALCLLAMAVEAKDRTLKGHCARLAHYAVALGKAIGLDAATLEALRRGPALHDIGKIWVPDAILFKPGPLTAEEWFVVREHPVVGEQMCRPLQGLQDVLPIIRHHHERPDGTGYPDGLAGSAIPLTAQILQVADVFDALTSPRPYRQPLPQPVALHSLRAKAARGIVHGELVEIFARLWAAGALKPTRPTVWRRRVPSPGT